MPKKIILTNIQQTRGIAATLVMIAHVLNSVMKRTSGVDMFVIDGGIGVDIFFVISGFIMVGVTHDRFGSLQSAKDFIIRRIARIVPIYWILTLVMAALLIVTRHPVGVSDLATSFAFFPVVGPEGKVRPVLGQGWTLELEMMFYVIFAGCLVFSKRTGMILLCTSLAALPLIGIADLPLPFEFWTSEIIVEFLFGIILGILYNRYGPADIARPLIPMSVLIIVMILGYHGPLLGWGRPLAWFLATGVVALACFSHQAKGNAFASKALIKLGDWSYSLYLVHIIVLAIFMGVSDRIFGKSIGILWGIALFLMINGASVLFAYLSYVFLERPLEKRVVTLLRALLFLGDGPVAPQKPVVPG